MAYTVCEKMKSVCVRNWQAKHMCERLKSPDFGVLIRDGKARTMEYVWGIEKPRLSRMCEGLKNPNYGLCVRDLKSPDYGYVWGIEKPRRWRMCEGLKSPDYGVCVRDWTAQTMAYVWGIEKPRLWLMCEWLKSPDYGVCVSDWKAQTMAYVWGIDKPRLWRMCEGLKGPDYGVSVRDWKAQTMAYVWGIEKPERSSFRLLISTFQLNSLTRDSSLCLYYTRIRVHTVYGSSNQREEMYRVADEDSYCVTERIPDLWQLFHSMFSTVKVFAQLVLGFVQECSFYFIYTKCSARDWERSGLLEENPQSSCSEICASLKGPL